MTRCTRRGNSLSCSRISGVLIIFAASTLASAAIAERVRVPEQALKAALVYKLMKFVEWPANDAQLNTAFNLCISGDGPMAKFLEELSGRPLRKREIVVKRIDPEAGVVGCNVLFAVQKPYENAINKSNGLPILTVSDIDDFTGNGGMIEITRKNRRLGFRIDPEIARAAGLNIATPLLELATIVD